MPIEFSWFLEGRVVYIRLGGTPDLETMLSVDQELVNYLDRGTAPTVHCIINNCWTERLPAAPKIMVTDFKSPRHPRIGWMMVYGMQDGTARQAASVTSQVMRVRHKMVESLDDALVTLNRIDTTLPNLRELRQGFDETPSTH
jgi:hypothetical protein